MHLFTRRKSHSANSIKSAVTPTKQKQSARRVRFTASASTPKALLRPPQPGSAQEYVAQMIAKSATRPPPSRSIIRGSLSSTPAPSWRKQRVTEYVQSRQVTGASISILPSATLMTGGSVHLRPATAGWTEYVTQTHEHSYKPAYASPPELIINPISTFTPPSTRSVASSHTCSAEGSASSDDSYANSAVHKSIDVEISRSLKHILTQELGHIFALPVYHFLPSDGTLKASMRQMRVNWVDFCIAHGIAPEAMYLSSTFGTYARHFMSLTVGTWHHRQQKFSLATLRGFVVNLAYIINSFARDPSLPGSPVTGPNLLLGGPSSVHSRGLFRQLVVHGKYLRRHYGTKIDGLPLDQLRLWA